MWCPVQHRLSRRVAPRCSPAGGQIRCRRQVADQKPRRPSQAPRRRRRFPREGLPQHRQLPRAQRTGMAGTRGPEAEASLAIAAGVPVVRLGTRAAPSAGTIRKADASEGTLANIGTLTRQQGAKRHGSAHGIQMTECVPHMAAAGEQPAVITAVAGRAPAPTVCGTGGSVKSNTACHGNCR